MGERSVSGSTVSTLIAGRLRPARRPPPAPALTGDRRLGVGPGDGTRAALALAGRAVRVAWRHLGRHVWRYELEPLDGGVRTRVTKTFDWAPLPVPWLLELLGYSEANLAAIEATLRRLREPFL